MKRLLYIFFPLISFSFIEGCTGLEETYPGNLTNKQLTNTAENTTLLYNNLLAALRNAYQNPFGGVISMSTMTTDEFIGPTRAGNWDDNGVWRQLHQHRWNGDNTIITASFNDLNGVVFAATDFLRFNPSTQQAAAARFYRAFAMYWELDLFDQIPYRDPGESTLEPARVKKGVEALEYIISEVNDVINDLPTGDPTQPNKYAAKVFLMKCYLNKGVYENRLSPSFSKRDMNSVISLADEVINSNQFTFSDNYFDNFAPDNNVIGKENIFTQENVGGVPSNSLLSWYAIIPLHYNSTPFGFNGWTTTSDFYDRFESIDLRRGQAYNTPGGPANPGNRVNMGFLIGQQYNLNDDTPLTYGNPNPKKLEFTREVKVIETEANLDVTGIRPQKYAIDYINLHSPFDTYMNNDWVYFRLPDVLLMKAEAILRGGSPTSSNYGSSALELVNAIRTNPSRGASALASIDLKVLLDERGRELYLECWRRQDMVRFGTFLEPFQEKDYTSDPNYLIFPIPSQQLAVNKNLKQNPGY